MNRPIFIVRKWPSANFPYVFECNRLNYQAVFSTLEGGKQAIEARFGNCIFRVKVEVNDG